jgi:hypothetical protein
MPLDDPALAPLVVPDCEPLAAPEPAVPEL